MGKEHGKDTVRPKSSKKRMKKTYLMKLNDWVRNTPKSMPYVDEHLGVLWGTNRDDPTTIANAKKSDSKKRHTKHKKNAVKKEVYSRIPVYKLIDID